MGTKRTYEAPKLTSEKVFLPALSANTTTNPYGGFKRPHAPPPGR